MDIKVVLVDDEPLALRRLESLLRLVEDCRIVGSYTDANQALERLQDDQPDIIFLDIEMPETDGLTFAAEVQEVLPQAKIAFVTAHTEYAVDAFGLDALDYLVKPISRERLAITLQRLSKRLHSYFRQPSYRLQCLGRLQLQTANDEPIELKWRTVKIRELFSYLLHHRNQVVSRDTLLQMLWPELDERRGLANLQTSIYRIRTLLKQSGMEQAIRVSFSQYGYSLELREATVDTEEWERQLGQLEPIMPHNLAEHQRLFKLYHADYYADHDYHWAEPERRRLRAIWLQLAEDLGRFCADHGRDREALSVYHRIVQVDPLYEDGYLALMQLYDRIQDPGSVQAQFRLLTEQLRQEADVAPGQAITAWYQKWKQANLMHTD